MWSLGAVVLINYIYAKVTQPLITPGNVWKKIGQSVLLAPLFEELVIRSGLTYLVSFFTKIPLTVVDSAFIALHGLNTGNPLLQWLVVTIMVASTQGLPFFDRWVWHSMLNLAGLLAVCLSAVI